MAKAQDNVGRIGFRAGVVGSLVYSLVRLLLDVMATSRRDQAMLQAEVLALRRQVQLLKRQKTNHSSSDSSRA